MNFLQRYTTITCFFVLVGSVNAASVSEINWKGQLTITGFSTLSRFDDDGNPTTMTLRYEIADGSSHTIGLTNGSEIVSGSIIIKDLLAIGNDLLINQSMVSHIAEHATAILPVGTVTFPPGVTSPGIDLSGNPITTVNVHDAGSTVINSNLAITRESFLGNIFEEDITEVSALGLSSLSVVFNSFDSAFGNSDGIISRPFEVNIQLAPVPVPAAGWMFISGVIGLLAVRRKHAS